MYLIYSILIFLNFILFKIELYAQKPKQNNLGQLLFIGINGTELTPQLESQLLTIKPGGVILFKRNILNLKQISQFNSDILNLFKKNELPIPFLAIDQEGGIVYRIPTQPLLPSAAALGRIQNPNLMHSYGKEIGNILKKLGFSMNLAPVLDLRSKDNDFIGTRSLGSDPNLVSSLAFSFSQGLLESGIIPTGKHFPGAGGIRVDPHLATPIGDLEWSKSWNKELKPFRDFAKLSTSALMLSHIVYPKLDPSNKPATLSSSIIKSGLREKINYQGLIITDDMMMEGVNNIKNDSNPSLEALKAGVDMVMMTWSFQGQKKLIEDIELAIQNKTLSKVDIELKLNRILNLKKQLLKDNRKLAAQESINSITLKSNIMNELNNSLLQNILHADNKLSQKTKNEISLQNEPLLVIEAPKKLQDEIRLLRDSTTYTEFLTLKKSDDWKKIKEKLSNEPKLKLVFFIKSLTVSRSINWFTKKEKERFIIVNLQAPGLPYDKSYLGYFSPYWQFENLYSAISKVLKIAND